MSGQHLDMTQKNRRLDVLFGLLILGGILSFALLGFWLQSLSRDLRISNEARDALARQVQQLGEKPVAGPPGSRGDPGQSVVGPRGATGPSGARGPSGATGKTGSKGDTGASATASPGATGPQGPSGAQGAPGPAGPAGQDGQDGTDGQDGQTCPDGYSLQSPSYDEDALVCRRDGAPDPTPSDTSSTPQTVALDPNRRVYA